jgi:4'-phosphopantetheinyl transferase
MAAFGREADRTRFVLGAVLLRLAVSLETGITPIAVRVDRRCPTCGTEHGAPHLIDTALQVSVSHSGTLIAVAVTPAGPVGVDVEDRATRVALPPCRNVLTSAEPSRGADDFLTYWCRKESVLKATGAGLTVSMLEVVVSPADEPARLVSYNGNVKSACMSDLDLGCGYAAAVTVLTDELDPIDIVWGDEALAGSGI